MPEPGSPGAETCTGYKISFPFFDRDFLDPGGDNEVRLYKRMFHPTVPGLYFIGLVQPLGAIMPISERQSELVADHLQGCYALPEPAEMDAEIDRHRKAVAKRYVASKRHTIQVDFDDYMRVLRWNWNGRNMALPCSICGRCSSTPGWSRASASEQSSRSACD
jgi:hypothetical protein